MTANLRAMSEYVPEKYNGPIVFFKAQAELPEDGPDSPERRWAELASGGVEVHVVPGDHFTMNESPNVARIAEVLRRFV